MGSKYFGRALKRWRLFAGISQEDLAKRAQVSVTLLGTIERERGHLSEEIFSKLCLGLESKLGKPMLRAVFSEGVASLWQELSATHGALRQERGLEPDEQQPSEISQGQLEQSIDSVFAEMRKAVMLFSRSLRSQTLGQDWSQSAHFQSPGSAQDGQARVRSSGRKRRRED